MAEQTRLCKPSCHDFRCAKQALVTRGNQMFCNWVEDYCEGPTCNFALCAERRLLANGVCGMALRRKTMDKDLEQVATGIRVRGKLYQRLREREIY